ncbi:MAG TPA: creatininase family protein [Spirochaetes bacterium]|nr:creatininase family protein [Spirochaetota bacterium]
MKLKFEEMRSPEIAGFAEKNGMVLVPIGACEEHGRHLPVITDTKMAYSAALDAARSVSGEIPISVLPAVWFGYSVNMLKNWAGTITIRPKVMIDLMYEICRSLIDMGLNRILIVNGHGNNPGLLDVVVRTVGDDFKVFPAIVNIFNCWDKDYVKKNRKSGIGGIGHAGEVETSVMLYLSDLVDMSVADSTDIMKTDLDNCPVDFGSDKKKKMYLSTWFLENSTYGGAGDPTHAAKEFGEKIHAMTVDAMCGVIREFYEAQVSRENRKLNRKSARF